MELESLESRRTRCKVKWWSKFNIMDDERYPRLLLHSEWERKGRQKTRGKQLVNCCCSYI